MKAYKYRNKIYSVLPCTIEDVPSHLEKVRLYYGDQVEYQRLRMIAAIENSNAYKLVDDTNDTKVFAYWESHEDDSVLGIALWWSNLKLFLIFGRWFRETTFTNMVYIDPHAGSLSFRFLIEDQAFRHYHSTGHPYWIDMYSAKIHKLAIMVYEKMGVEEV